ncbi:cryptochrome/photolyase family protein [Brumimicrobium aurantiacum]|uniref:Deoxyribodipyrimidine photo-lyase n=1 Tax=Brumimicrobium aurantiacum TaxID=1737063 RepID=A0A3E1F1L9_9FLAO|nr:deoxyribodipyrimidine photo-lyase [Brumimicrobium aurantiacum]RFC55722.1 deoxyribodipyrimidine photo-lyase [Brumimicrobium aurantiacum]
MTIFWHRRDLRLEDNAGLFAALRKEDNVQPIFIFDKNILEDLNKNDQRVLFIHQYIQKLKDEYQNHGADLWVFYGTPIEVFQKLIKDCTMEKVYTNRDYEPYAKSRDEQIQKLLSNNGIQLKTLKDHVIMEGNEVLKSDDTPYRVFTPYMRQWKKEVTAFHLKSYPVKKYLDNLHQSEEPTALISLQAMGFSEEQTQDFPPIQASDSIIKDYEKTRDIPSIKGTTRMSVHLRFGTISIRELMRQAQKNEKYYNELIWRDFYQMILYHFPKTVDQSFKPQYDDIPWENKESYFKAWCEGKTGYPIVDAGMRELNNTGFMHNRVRMIVASFLTKHLMTDWRLGEAYFAEKLLDYEMASNVGGWQWAASSGVDAQPYFRVFNPTSQQEKFDSEFKYIKKWVPEYGTDKYPEPIVEHKKAREHAIAVFKEALA